MSVQVARWAVIVVFGSIGIAFWGLLSVWRRLRKQEAINAAMVAILVVLKEQIVAKSIEREIDDLREELQRSEENQ